MFKNFELKFTTGTQMLFGWAMQPTGVKSTTHTVCFAMWTLTVIVHHE